MATRPAVGGVEPTTYGRKFNVLPPVWRYAVM